MTLQPGQVYWYKGKPYLLLHIARDHHTDAELAVYVPLYYRTEWEGTPRVSIRTVDEFASLFAEEAVQS